jgi:hypothetical protein
MTPDAIDYRRMLPNAVEQCDQVLVAVEVVGGEDVLGLVVLAGLRMGARRSVARAVAVGVVEMARTTRSEPSGGDDGGGHATEGGEKVSAIEEIEAGHRAFLAGDQSEIRASTPRVLGSALLNNAAGRPPAMGNDGEPWCHTKGTSRWPPWTFRLVAALAQNR